MFVIRTYTYPLISEGIFSPPAPGNILTVTEDGEDICFHVVIDTETNVYHNCRILLRKTEEDLDRAFGTTYIGYAKGYYVFYEVASIQER